MSLRSAPRRAVTRIDRVGNYPNVQWRHHLECGHIEVRKRQAPGSKMGCRTCSRQDQPGEQVPVDRALIDEEVLLERDAQRARAALARHFGVSQEDIEVVMRLDGNGPSVVHAIIWVRGDQVTKIVGGK